MPNRSLSYLIFCCSLAVTNRVYSQSIEANNSLSPQRITTTDIISIAISHPGSAETINHDWWIAVVTSLPSPDDIYYFDGNTWTTEFSVAYQQPLIETSALELLNGTGLPAGTYTFYFGTDTVANGELDVDSLAYDSIVVVSELAVAGTAESCGNSRQLFSVDPLESDAYNQIDPLGATNPSGHTFPTAHTYMMLQDNTQPRNVRTPADIGITQINVVENLTAGGTDYSLNFTTCPEVSGYFYHLSTLNQTLQNLLVSETDTKAIKEEELRQIVESETEEGTLEVEEREMIEGIFEFADTTVKEVMIPRIDMVCAELSTSQQEILDLIQESRHSRIPIYRERVDHIEGVVYVKDLLHALSSGQKWDIEELMRAPYFVPETKKIDELLREFKTARIHMAIVVGEYGGTSGLVTMEDLIEEIVGEIQDEYDEEIPLFRWTDDDRILIADARLPIEELNLLLNVDLPQDGYETLGGFIYNHLGRVPSPQESFDFGNLALSIEDVEGQRITTVQIEKRQREEDREDAAEEIA